MKNSENSIIKKKKVYIASNGCDRRLLDSQKISDFAKANENEIVNNANEADLIFVNTCSMSQTAEDTSVNLIRKFESLKGELIIHGCLPQISPDRFKKEFDGTKYKTIDAKDLDRKVDEVFPESKLKYSEFPDPIVLAKDQGLISKIFNKLKFNELFFLTIISALRFKLKNPSLPLHPRIKKGAYLQISSGCTDTCSYCAIPKAIGSIKSKSISVIRHEYSKLLENGERDFVFTSDNLGLYGVDSKSSIIDLFNELKLVDRHFKNVQWIFNEFHPKWANKYKDDLLNLVEIKKIKELCIPIQSGNDRILNLMKRNNKSIETLETLKQIKVTQPQLRLTTDVIVGFPTETDDEFLDTIRFITQVKFDQVMFFSFGKREGTAAAEIIYDEKENEKNINRRMKMAIKILNKENINYTLQ